MPDPQQQLQKFLDRTVSEGRERGAQLAVYHRGKLVIDAFAGVTDATGDKKVDGDTLFPIFSCTKGLVATLANLLVERGKISYDTPIAVTPGVTSANGVDVPSLLPADVRSQFGPSNLPFSEDLYFGKIDWELSDRDRLEASGQVRLEEFTRGGIQGFLEVVGDEFDEVAAPHRHIDPGTAHPTIIADPWWNHEPAPTRTIL